MRLWRFLVPWALSAASASAVEEVGVQTDGKLLESPLFSAGVSMCYAGRMGLYCPALTSPLVLSRHTDIESTVGKSPQSLENNVFIPELEA